MKKAKLISFIIKLKQAYYSGWIPFGSKNLIGISNKLYKRLFHQAIENNLLRKGNRGYFINGFIKCLNITFGKTSKYIKIYNKSGDYKETIQVILVSMAHHKITQQYATARKIIHEKRGKLKNYIISAHLNEGILAQVRISCRQIGRSIGVSPLKANEIIHKLKKMDLIRFKFPSTNKLINDYYINCNNGKKGWECERQVFQISKITAQEIRTLILCK